MIAGVIDRTNPVESRGSLRRMVAAGATYLGSGGWECHHGPYRAWAASTPDGAAEVPSAPRLSPVLASDARTGSWIVADATIYNRAELIESLGIETAEPAGESDAALLLAAYQCWGPELLRRAVGDFAFVIWDGREESLFAAVDAFGLRPFYYSSSQDRLAFASRPRMLEALPWVGDEVDQRQVARFLIDHYDDPAATFSQNIRQLPMGNCLHLDRGGRLTVRRYWDPSAWPRNDCRSPEHVLERFEELLRLAVRQRLDPRAPTGLVMSGGFDSTAVAGMVADIGRRQPSALPPVTVVSWVFGDLPCDESDYIRAALRDFAFPSRLVCELEGGNDIEQMVAEIRRHDIPLLDPQGRLMAAFIKAAQSLGVASLMTGLGGDELATDLGYEADLVRAGRLVPFLRHAHQARKQKAVGVAGDAWSATLGRGLREACPQAVKQLYRRVRGWLGLAPTLPAPPDWLTRQASSIALRIAPVYPDGFRAFPSRSAEICWNAIVNPYSNWANRSWGIEFEAFGMRTSAPLLDRRLFEFVFNVPPRLRPWRGGHELSKLFLTQGAARCIPEEIRRRDAKVHFASYNRRMFDNGLDALIVHLFEEGAWHAEPFVARASAQALFDSYRLSLTDASQDWKRARVRISTLWRIAGLELWLRSRRPQLCPPIFSKEHCHGPTRKRPHACPT